MLLRKINAGLSLLAAILFLNHAVFLAVWMLSRCSIQSSALNMPWVLVGVFGIHIVICLILYARNQKDAKGLNYKVYPKMNIPSLVQRISGLLMILLLGLHIAGAANHFQPKMLHAIAHPLFFAAGLAHVSISTSKALITLGIGSAKTIRIVDIIMKVLCLSTFAASTIGFYLCLFVGVAR